MHSKCHIAIDAEVAKWTLELDNASVNAFVQRHLRLCREEIIAPVTLERLVDNVVHLAMLSQLAWCQEFA